MRRVLRTDPEFLGLASIAARFTRYGVRYAAIGGFATACYLSERRADDLDIVIAATVGAARRAYKAIGSMAVSPRFGVNPYHVLGDAQLLADGDQIIVPTALGTLHIVGSHLPVGVQRDGVIDRKQWILVGSRLVAVCGLQDLIMIKTLARHGNDLEDVVALVGSLGKPGHNPEMDL